MVKILDEQQIVYKINLVDNCYYSDRSYKLTPLDTLRPYDLLVSCIPTYIFQCNSWVVD